MYSTTNITPSKRPKRSFSSRSAKNVLYQRRSRTPRYIGEFAKAVGRVIAGKEETKQITQQIVSNTLFNGSISSSGECYNVIPDVPRGTTSAERIGDKISPMWVKLRFQLTITGGLPRHCHLFVLRDKINNEGSSTRDYNFLNLNGTDTNFDGSWFNAGLPVNTEDFQLIKRMLLPLALDQQPSGTGTAATENSPMYRDFEVRIPMKAVLGVDYQLDYYGSPSTTYQPKNCNMFWALGYTNADGSVDSITTNVRVDCVSTFYYKDA